MNAAYAVYILISIGLVYFVYRDDRLDFRGVGRLLRRPTGGAPPGEEADFAAPPDAAEEARALARERRRLARLVIEPRADFTVMLALGGLGALLMGAAIGFLAPLLLEAIASAGGASAGSRHEAATDLAALSYAADSPMARLAQAAGALCGAAVALRMLRIFMGLAALCASILLAMAALNFVIGRPTLALFGG